MPALTAAAAVVTFGALAGAPAWADNAAQGAAGTSPPVETQAAVWTPKEVQFTYMGFTTHYTCDGLRDTIRDMLLQLGARKDDLKVYEEPCSGNPDRPNPFPGVKVKMSVLQPASGHQSAGTQTVQAYWKTVQLPRDKGINASGQCELLEQFNRKFMPLFTTRNVDLQTRCVPHQAQPGGTQLQTEVLVTDQKKAVTKQASAAEER